MQNAPSPSELVLLKALWYQGSLPVRRLHEACAPELKWSFSSTRKTLERMVDKGFVEISKVNEKPSAPARVRALVSKTTTLAHLARDFFRRVLEVDGRISASAFTCSTLLSDEELDELEGLLGGGGV